jgi:hypothetical protein
MKAGTYKCKINESYGIGESKIKGTLFVAVNLKIMEEESKQVHLMQWNGWLSDRAIETTNKALAVMGMAAPNYELLAEGKGLDINKQFFCTVEDEVGQDGKVYSRVKWINETEGGGKVALLDKKSAIAKLSSMGLCSAVGSGNFSSDNIPF